MENKKVTGTLDLVTGPKNEDQLQAQLYQWYWNAYPEHRRKMWAVPNGAERNPVQAALLKATGLLSGVWDLHAYYQGKFHIIETKFGNGQLTVDRIVNGKKVYGQKEWGEIMAAEGATRHIYRTLPEGQAIIATIFGKPGKGV